MDKKTAFEFITDITSDVANIDSKGFLDGAIASHLKQFAARNGYPVVTYHEAIDLLLEWRKSQ